jgi:hypothetical protein
MQKKLARAIDKEMNSKISSKSKSKANVELILRAVTKENAFLKDVEELVLKLDHLYMMSAWKNNWILFFLARKVSFVVLL